MAVFDKIQNIMDKTIAPVASKVADSKMLDALMGGMMCTLPMTLGVSVIAILINFPIPGFSDWVGSSGLMATGNSILTVTMNMMGIYISFFIGLRWGKVCGLSGYTGGIVSGAVFLAFMPQQSFEDIPMASFINTSYMGSNGIFVAILLGLIVPKVTAILMSKLEIKLPDMVPPMVADSLSPMFAAIVLFTAVWFAKWGLSFTPWGNLFDMINTLIGTPVTMVGASPLAYIIVCSLQSIFWFFGVHPNVMLNFYAPVIMACSAANTEAIIAGEALPYGAWAVVALGTAIGGQANALGISISLLFTKSERFKAIRGIALVPSLFNISEPLMFGLPVVLNPTYFIPFVLNIPVCAIVVQALYALGLGAAFNPTIQLPWVLPQPVIAFMQGGIGCLVISVAVLAVSVLMYTPFTLMADRQALREEQAALEESAA
ncbi:PTS sugar transporter subunit IIC [Collinsella sp. AM20-15AC]|uniref:PTS sugar transporter subunit IIC n=1 Tax=Collinsella sp. AM20-15AC TaxID=2292029 RepID=UPI000E528699|nr:PTS transporter subunit EIIC [Collinsella sp. AM20-15AC]RHH00506.1 PTS sugar transporter subunit IIC [Collinsella sp. AM20-15AC]